MCDYSLHGIQNRLAVEGEELVVHRFATGTVGMASGPELDTARARFAAEPSSVWAQIRQTLRDRLTEPTIQAVCVPPGAELAIRQIPPDVAGVWNVRPGDKVRFTQVSASTNTHRDAFKLPSGEELILQRVREGIRLEVVSLGGTPAPDAVVVEAEFEPVTTDGRDY